jgi:hypothetical protein
LMLGLRLAWTSKREQSCTKSTDSCNFVYASYSSSTS